MGTESRRGVLKKGLWGGALLLLGSGTTLFVLPGKDEGAPREGLHVLSKRGYAVVAALARRLIPDVAGKPTVDQLRVAFVADRILAKTDATARDELQQLLGLFENALPNLLFGGRATPFTMLDAQAQDLVLAEWRDSTLTLRRTGFQALRGLVMASYYSQPETWAATGYPGPPQGFHQPNAKPWRGGFDARPIDNGVWQEPKP